MTRRNLYLLIALTLAALAGIWGYSNNQQLQISLEENVILKDSVQTLLLENNRLEGALSAYTNAYHILAQTVQQQQPGLSLPVLTPSSSSTNSATLASSEISADRSNNETTAASAADVTNRPAAVVPPANAERAQIIREPNPINTELQQTVGELEQERQSLVEENAQLNEELEQVQVGIQSLTSERDAALNAQQEISSTLDEVVEEKEELAAELTVAQEENEQLEAQQLQLTQLSERMRRRLEEMSVSDLGATDFQVSLLKDVNGRLTTRANQVKQITVSFLLNNVPERYQGRQGLFLVVTDSSGNPVTGEHPIKVQSRINGNVVELLALTGKDADLTDMQRVTFNQQLNWRALRAGNYRVQVFTNFGLLGTAGFAVE
ncbi:MAG: hypothetical protein AAF433_00815 [Bacteroidota bacterium]